MRETAPDAARSVGVVEIGHLGSLSVRIVAANLQAILGVPVDVLASVEVPRDAFRPHRHQYDAAAILQFLDRLEYPHHPRLLGLTSVDLCIPILTHVFGEAQLGGRVAVASSYRLRHHPDGTTAPVERYYERLAKVALHEMGHTLSAYHCDHPRCLMRYCPKVQQLDALHLSFCGDCAFILRRSLRELGLDPSWTGTMEPAMRDP